MATPLPPRSLPWAFLPTVLALVAVLGVIGLAHYDAQRRALHTAQRDTLTAIAGQQAREVAAWRQRRLDDARVLMHNPFLGAQARRFFLSPTPAAEATHLTWMAAMKRQYGYLGIDLIDDTGMLRLSYGDLPERSTALPDDRDAVVRALATREVCISEPYRDRDTGEGRLDCAAPIIVVEDGRRRLAGVAVLVSDPATLLAPMPTWPTPSATAETVLVRQDGDEVTYLTTPRHQADGAKALTRSVSAPRLVEARAVGGLEGIAEGVDYRNTPVLAAAKAVPDTPWFVVAKVDRAELQTPLPARTLPVAAAAGALAFLATLIVGARRRRSHPGALSCDDARDQLDATQRYDLLMQYAHDIIIILNETGCIVDANERALQAYGYTHEEIIARCARDLRVDAGESGGVLLTEVGRPDGALFETQHRRRDGSIFPVEVSSRMVVVQGEAVYLCIMRDITDRLEAARELEEEHARLAVTLQNIGDGVIALDARGWITLMNDAAAEITGCAAEEAVGRPLDEFYRTDEPAGTMGEHGAVATLRAGGTVGPSTHVTLTTCDGATRRVAQRVSPIRDGRGRIVGGVLVFHERSATGARAG